MATHYLQHLMAMIGIVIAGLAIFFAAEIMYILISGSPVPTPTIPRDPALLGQGPEITFVVIGDSTSIGQGADYHDSYTVAAAEQLAKQHRVRLVNVGVSGARAADVAKDQLPLATHYRPDIVLLAVGANDATHFTRGDALSTALQTTFDGLKRANPKVQIVVTEAPAMGSVPRFPWPITNLMQLRTTQINNVYAQLSVKNKLFVAPIAAKTGATFAAHPELFAADKFHPNAHGYALWKPIINQELAKLSR